MVVGGSGVGRVGGVGRGRIFGGGKGGWKPCVLKLLKLMRVERGSEEVFVIRGKN